MAEKRAPLTKAELDLLTGGKNANNKEWAFIQDNSSRISLPEDGQFPLEYSQKKKKPKVPAQRLSNGESLPDVETPDWTDH